MRLRPYSFWAWFGPMHAVHAVVDAADIVRLLGPLRAAGASSILVLPIEHLIA